MKFSLTRVGEVLQIGVRGDINEAAEAELSELSEKIEVGRVTFETSRVDLINSLGIRSWIQFVQGLRRKGVTIEYQKCSSSVVDCCNMHKSFALPGEVASLFVPMFCKKCEVEESQLFLAKDLKAGEAQSTIMCPKCSKELLPAVDLETYVAFLD